MTPGERGAIQRIVREAKTVGFLVYGVWDGEEFQRHPEYTKERPVPMTEAQVCEACASVDDSSIRFRHADGRIASALIVLGNAPDGSELPADNSCGDILQDFADAMDRVTAAG